SCLKSITLSLPDALPISKKRGDVNRILELLVGFGASDKILVDAHPHIGTNKLPKIMEDMRLKIIECGGEVLFDHKVTDLIIQFDRIKGVEINNEFVINSDAVILATGHSARDIFEMLHR